MNLCCVFQLDHMSCVCMGGGAAGDTKLHLRVPAMRGAGSVCLGDAVTAGCCDYCEGMH